MPPRAALSPPPGAGPVSGTPQSDPPDGAVHPRNPRGVPEAGIPDRTSGEVHLVTFRPSGGAPVQVMDRQLWEYRNRDETWSILLPQDTVILQTTAYTRFEDFVERLQMAVHTVLAESEHDELGVVRIPTDADHLGVSE